MTVEPLSQLTIRIVPASTSRRNPATMKGSRTSTATGTATTRIHWGIGTSIHLRTDVRHRTTVPPAIHIFHAEAVAVANATAGGAVLRTQCSEHLDELAVDFCRDETLAVRVEAGGCPHFVLDAAFERQRGSRSEPHQEVPGRADDAPLEQHAARQRRAEYERLRQGAAEQQPGRSKTDEPAEDEPRRCEAPQPGRRRRARAAPVVRLPAPPERVPVPRPPTASQLRANVAMPMAAESRQRHRYQSDGANRQAEQVQTHATARACVEPSK